MTQEGTEMTMWMSEGEREAGRAGEKMGEREAKGYKVETEPPRGMKHQDVSIQTHCILIQPC